jgi:hypothetical protein
MYPDIVIPFFDYLCLFVTGVDPLSRWVGEVHMFFIHTIWTSISDESGDSFKFIPRCCIHHIITFTFDTLIIMTEECSQNCIPK